MLLYKFKSSLKQNMYCFVYSLCIVKRIAQVWRMYLVKKTFSDLRTVFGVFNDICFCKRSLLWHRSPDLNPSGLKTDYDFCRKDKIVIISSNSIIKVLFLFEKFTYIEVYLLNIFLQI